VSFSTWNAAALGLGIPAALDGPWSVAEGSQEVTIRATWDLFRNLSQAPSSRLITALAGAAAHDAVTPGPGCPMQRCDSTAARVTGSLRCRREERSHSVRYAAQAACWRLIAVIGAARC